MLARTADNLFWLARSMERADYIARTIEATLRLEYLPKSDGDRKGGVGERPQRRRRLRQLHRGARRTRRGGRRRVPHLRSNQLVLDLQLPGKRPRRRAGRAHRAHRRDLDRDQRRLARTQALRGEPSSRKPARPDRADPLPRLREEGLARLRRLLLPHDAAQRRLLVQPARAFSSSAPTTRRGSSTSNTICSCPRPSRRRLARLFPVGGDPARGLGRDRLSLGLSRPGEAVADRRSARSSSGRCRVR